MSERDPIATILERVERPVAADARFADDLLDELLADLGDDDERPRRRSGRTRPALGWRKALAIAASFAIAAAGLSLLAPLVGSDAIPASVGELGPFPLVPYSAVTHRPLTFVR